MIRKTAIFLAAALAAMMFFCGCSADNNSQIVGKWIPSTVNIGGSSVAYSDIAKKGREFSLDFESSGKCTLVLGGITNEGSYVFNETSVDVEYGSKKLKLDYSGGIITLALNYNNQSTSYMFTKLKEEY